MEINFNAPNKNHQNPFFRYEMFSVSKVSTKKYPELVEITRGPKWAKEIVGKKFLDEKYAIKYIDAFKAINLIEKSKTKVIKTLEKEGFNVDAALEAMSEE
jgi:hypothetical protein